MKSAMDYIIEAHELHKLTPEAVRRLARLIDQAQSDALEAAAKVCGDIPKITCASEYQTGYWE